MHFFIPSDSLCVLTFFFGKKKRKICNFCGMLDYQKNDDSLRMWYERFIKTASHFSSTKLFSGNFSVNFEVLKSKFEHAFFELFLFKY